MSNVTTNPVLKFLAKNPFGAAVKVAIGAGLAWLIDNSTLLNLSPLAVSTITIFAPAIINYINPADPRYGKGSAGIQ